MPVDRRIVVPRFGRSRRSNRRPGARRGSRRRRRSPWPAGPRRARPPASSDLGRHVGSARRARDRTRAADLDAPRRPARPQRRRRRRARRWPGAPCRTAAPSPSACRGRRPSPHGTRRARRRRARRRRRRSLVRAAKASRPASDVDRGVDRCRCVIFDRAAVVRLQQHHPIRPRVVLSRSGRAGSTRCRGSSTSSRPRRRR